MANWRALVLSVALGLTAGPALAAGQDLAKLERGNGRGGGASKAPEIEPAALGGAIALLVGGTFLVGARVARRRRQRVDQQS